ncbi:MAG: hypothetical protein V4438_01385 [Patescibacteria group bacterium]
MTTNPMIWIGMTVGSLIGGFVPLLWGGDSFSFSGILWNAIGAIAGIYAGYRLSNW